MTIDGGLLPPRDGLHVRVLPSEPMGFGASMYDVLHELEDEDCAVVWVQVLPAADAWNAIRDRLNRLASEILV